MALTYGFYNSLNGDRKYDVLDISKLFDGLISDGIYRNIGGRFMVKAKTGMSVVVQTGRAWFNHTWTYLDSPLVLTVPPAESVLRRIDAVVLEVDSSINRTNAIKIVKGPPSTGRVYPSLIDTQDIHQHILAYIELAPNTKSILQENIENRVGTMDSTFVNSILSNISIDDLTAQWQNEWENRVVKTEDSLDDWIAGQKIKMAGTDTEFNDWFTGQKVEMAAFLSGNKNEFDTWFADFKGLLEGDAAANMSNKILEFTEIFDTIASSRAITSQLEDNDGSLLLDGNGAILTAKVLMEKN